MIAVLFFGFMTLLSLGIIGIYVWRISENVRGRPNAIVARREVNDAAPVIAATIPRHDMDRIGAERPA
jgi:hypothetical protein